MSITDVSLANDVVYKMLENGAADADFTQADPLFTDMFTKQEIIDSMNRVQQEFLLETGMIVTRTSITPEVGKPKYDLPADCIRPRRVTWGEPLSSETPEPVIIRALTQVDTWELDNGMNEWPSDRDVPLSWWETTLPQQQIGIAKTPINDGTIGLLYVRLAAALDGTGVNLTVPDDWTPYILYGTLAELLSSDGQAFDPVRASYCDQRFQEGIELAKLVIGG